ncbi:glyoxylate reductase/hydroxypyruvate reductase [Pectinophora gossypiella]|uniref:glyoxylate reductase/hydroxypyruvate reductase n=1 Tax=Pectinophora gossypiella TaxID=13191 RepID=UPI00214EE8CA|nr:glyoxylate reductase/hydroxypyruvate reductase [Pectinophora gossypiella]XP_049876393.1 glyoxylate reductase/hydroxypyruvate reductase [Pectinophora gossypiella]
MIYKGIVSGLCRCRGLDVISRTMSSASRPQVFVSRSDMPECGIKLLKKECDVKLWSDASPVPRAEFLKSVAGVNGIFCSLTDKIDKEILDAAGPNLKVVSTISVGYDHIDVSECTKRGIRIGYTPDVLTDATAELTVALLLTTSRRLPEAQHEAKSGGWVSWAPTWMTGPGLAGSTVGIVGFGRIGQAVARRVKAFSTKKILYVNRSERPEAKETGAIKVNFDELLTQSDFVICCAALVPETKAMFNKEAFGKMKRSAVFVNTSRGGTVDQDALIEALQNNTIWAAGLDVTTPEPLPLDSPLFKLKNCVILPHIGSATIEARNIMSELTAKNILAAINGKEMPAELKV